MDSSSVADDYDWIPDAVPHSPTIPFALARIIRSGGTTSATWHDAETIRDQTEFLLANLD